MLGEFIPLHGEFGRLEHDITRSIEAVCNYFGTHYEKNSRYPGIRRFKMKTSDGSRWIYITLEEMTARD